MPLHDRTVRKPAIATHSERTVLQLVILATLVLAGGALFLTVSGAEPLDALFRHPAALPIAAALLAWYIVAMAIRLAVVGKFSAAEVPKTLLVYTGARLACLFAMGALLACWLAAFAFGLAVAPPLLGAAILLAIVNAFGVMVTGGCLNSILLLRHLWAAR
jgi:hypothetical protein